MRRFFYYWAVGIALIAGLAAIAVGIWLAGGGATDCECTRTETIVYGIGQVITGLFLLGGAIAALRKSHNSAWILWLLAIIAGGFLFFWIWQIALPVILILLMGIFVIPTTPERTLR